MSACAPRSGSHRRGSVTLLLIVLLTLVGARSTVLVCDSIRQLRADGRRILQIQAREWALSAAALRPGDRVEAEGWRLQRTASSAIAESDGIRYEIVFAADGGIAREQARSRRR